MKKHTILSATIAAAAAFFCSFGSAPEKSPANPTDGSARLLPLQVTAHDMLTKVYAAVPDSLPRQEMIAATGCVLGLTPKTDEYGLWLESPDGYHLSYYGLIPDVSAMVCFDASTDRVDNYCFFFQFPYEAGMRATTNNEVCRFCGSLVQELSDMGLNPGVNVLSDALFQLEGEYADRAYDITLSEESGQTSSGHFVLCISVEPAIGA